MQAVMKSSPMSARLGAVPHSPAATASAPSKSILITVPFSKRTASVARDAHCIGLLDVAVIGALLVGGVGFALHRRDHNGHELAVDQLHCGFGLARTKRLIGGNRHADAVEFVLLRRTWRGGVSQAIQKQQGGKGQRQPHRNSFRITIFKPDHTSLTAATFTSTSPTGNSTSRITSSVMSVATWDDFFGHEIQMVPPRSILSLS